MYLHTRVCVSLHACLHASTHIGTYVCGWRLKTTVRWLPTFVFFEESLTNLGSHHQLAQLALGIFLSICPWLGLWGYLFCLLFMWELGFQPRSS